MLPCHAAIEDSTRAANLKAFLAAHDQAPLALVCTDRASRGLDSSCCSHVVLFDFPRDPSEYMRRWHFLACLRVELGFARSLSSAACVGPGAEDISASCCAGPVCMGMFCEVQAAVRNAHGLMQSAW